MAKNISIGLCLGSPFIGDGLILLTNCTCFFLNSIFPSSVSTSSVTLLIEFSNRFSYLFIASLLLTVPSRKSQSIERSGE